jgi:2-polyprenyl-6-methoxyphenol hydroxylase-like FAD-dependent oxidoreductase
MPLMPDIIIIGAGPAGCIAAIMLARAGWFVRVVEQHRFPRDKACGECVSALGIEVARRLGLEDSLRRLGARELRHSQLIAPDGESANITFPSPMWGLSRQAMDECLLDAARYAGAAILQPARCERIVEGATPVVLIRDLASNAVRSLPCSRILVCDGKGPAHRSHELGIKAHFKSVSAAQDAISLFGVDGHYVGIAPIEGDRWNLAMSVPNSRVARMRGDFDALLGELLLENIAFRHALADAKRIGRWLASPLPRFSVQSRWPTGVIPLGNAAAAIDPIGGEGIGLAMRSAELAASELIDAERHGREIDVQGLRTQFKRLWRLRSAGCRAAAIAVSHPLLARLGAPIVNQTPALHRVALRMTGKL